MHLITEPVDVSYLLGVPIDKNDRVSLLYSESEKYVLCNALTSDQLRATLTDWIVLDTKEQHQEKIKELDTIIIDPNQLTITRGSEIKKLQKNVKECPDYMPLLRKRKTPEEVQKIATSQEVNEQALKNTLPQIKVGTTEKEIEQMIKSQYLALGASGWGFDPIVAFGSHSTNLHHKNSDTKLQKGDQILIDMGCIVDGYHSDMTRVIFTDKPTDLQSEILDLLIQSANTSLGGIKVGMTSKEAWEYGKSLLGIYGEYFTHCWGHGIGCEVHDLPYILPNQESMIEEGDVITIEPGIYIPDTIGMRYENIAYMQDGKLHKITQMPDKIQIKI